MSPDQRTVLPPRLAALAALVSPGARVADIGSDHGRLPLALLARGVAAFAVATEATAARAARIGRPPGEAPWKGAFETRFGRGLAPLRPDDAVDTLVIAGLGGRTILGILGVDLLARLHPAVLLLQPRTRPAEVRSWLSRQGWRLTAETLAAERGRHHPTLRAEPGGDADLYLDARLTRDDLLAAGPLLVRSGDPEVVRAWRREHARLTAILAAGRDGSEATARASRELARAGRILTRLNALPAPTSPPVG